MSRDIIMQKNKRLEEGSSSDSKGGWKVALQR